MKRMLFIPAVLAILFSSVHCFAQPPVTGTWSGKWKSIANSPQKGPISCTLSQSGTYVSGSATLWSTAINQYVTIPVSGTIKSNGFLNISGSGMISSYYCTAYLKGWVVGNTMVGGYGYTANSQWTDFGSCRVIWRY